MARKTNAPRLSAKMVADARLNLNVDKIHKVAKSYVGDVVFNSAGRPVAHCNPRTALYPKQMSSEEIADYLSSGIQLCKRCYK